MKKLFFIALFATISLSICSQEVNLGNFAIAFNNGVVLKVGGDTDNWHFHEGLAIIEMGGKQGFIDKQGNVIIQPIYDWVGYFKNGLALVRKNKKSGYVDKAGKVIVPIDYDKLGEFHEGLAMAMRDELAGFVNESGKPAISMFHEWSQDFHDGFARARRNGKNGTECQKKCKI